LIEVYLLNRLRDIGSLNLIGQTANRLFAHNGLIGVAEMATSCHLTPRQFERRFLDQVGVSPKLYARIVRFNAALDRKLQCPNRSWTEIAHALHYHDQMHMVHDFQDLAGNTPSQLFARLDIIPEFHSTFASSIHLHTSR
jgi:AraC-like DNA-binding protein